VSGRYPFATLAAIVAGVLMAVSGETLWAVVFFAIAAIFAAVTWRSAR
jgi:membrane protein implicated in regulation of membrane protease activity